MKRLLIAATLMAVALAAAKPDSHVVADEPPIATLYPTDAILAPEAPSVEQQAVLTRATADRTDGVTGKQLHFVYMVTAGGPDRQRDILDQFMPRSIPALNHWTATHRYVPGPA